MEVSKEFLERLNKKAEEINIHDMVTLGSSITDAFPKLLEMGKTGRVAYTEWNGKRYYSYMSEDEMFRVLCGKTKAEFEAYKERERKEWQDKETKNIETCKQAKKEKFLAWETAIKSAYSEEKAQEILSVLDRELDRGNVHCIKAIEEHISILENAKNNPQEAIETYQKSSNTPENRLYNHGVKLAQSKYASVFRDVLISDVREEYGMHGQDEVDKIISKLFNEVQEEQPPQQMGE